MKRRMMAALTALCLLLLPVAVPAQAEQTPVFSTMDELFSYLRGECIPALPEEISFGYTEQLDGLMRPYDAVMTIMYNCGLICWDEYHDRENRTVTLENIEYYQGFRIVACVAAGREALLTEEEAAALAEAEKIVSEVLSRTQDEYEIALAFHDELVRRVTYEGNDDEADWDSRDTAVGALLYGRAECDGYTDAYYLLGQLAGLSVGYQHGFGIHEDGSEERHLWNVIQWDGQWYQADVTWDDIGYEWDPQMGTYRYFSIGAGLMRENHRWEPALSPHPQAETADPARFFYTREQAEGGSLCYETIEAAAEAVKRAQKAGMQRIHGMVRVRDEGASQLNNALYRGGLKGGWHIWSYPAGEDTCFAIWLAE